MSEVCALEIMEKNDMITVEEKKFRFIFIEETKDSEPIDKMIVPAKKIYIRQKGEAFDKKFRNLMTSSGYICMPGSNYAGAELFFRKKDIDSFLDNLPKKEIIYTRPFPTAMSRYISEVGKERDLKIDGSEKVYANDFFSFIQNGSWGYQTKIEQLNITRERLEKEEKEEAKAIKFMEKLF